MLCSHCTQRDPADRTVLIYIPEIQLQTVFYLGFSKRNITFIQAPILRKKILLADKSDNHVLYRHQPNFVTAAAWYGLICKANGRKGKNYCLSFPEEVEKSYSLFYNVFLDVILYPCVLQQSWVLNTIPAPACLVALMIWHSCYRAQIFEVCGPRI